MRNAGFMHRLQARTLPAKVLPQYRDWATIGLAEVAPTVSIFVLGVLVSVLLLALECCCPGVRNGPKVMQQRLQTSSSTEFSLKTVQYWLRRDRQSEEAKDLFLYNG
jgi:hypothetical protein